MSYNVGVSDGIRVSWACETLNVYQRMVGKAVDGDPTGIDSIVAHLQRNLPRPSNRAEWIHLLHSLSLFLDRVGHVLHATFHARFTAGDCGALPKVWPEQDGSDLEASVIGLPAKWATEYAAWFNLHHTLPAALRTKLLLEEEFSEPLTIPRLAQAVGCSRTILIAQFTAAFGMPPAEYLARVRIREGLRRLRQSSQTIEQAAADVGYRSGNKFYARMRRYTDLTPARVREMTQREFEQLLEDRMSLRSPVAERRQVSSPVRAALAADRRQGQRRFPALGRRVGDPH